MIEVSTDIEQLMLNSEAAFREYQEVAAAERARFLTAIAEQLASIESALVAITSSETKLPEGRIKGEAQRTIFQLRSFASLLLKGDWLNATIDRGNKSRSPLPKPDIRKTLRPLGPVVIFGASNFPLAFSTAGGDTASALASGCSVIVKSHPAHPVTSSLVADAIAKAVADCQMPQFVFQHVQDGSIQVGQALVTHALTKAVAFTGSFQGGKTLFDLANLRKEPIPVFAEMGSINPVFVFPGAMEKNDLGNVLASSVLLGGGQFCTNPGLILTIENPGLDFFLQQMENSFSVASPPKMLHNGIADNFRQNKSKMLGQQGVDSIYDALDSHEGGVAYPAVAVVSEDDFQQNPVLQEEVFGPFTIVVRCKDLSGFTRIADILQGQLTTSVFATEDELKKNKSLVRQLAMKSGRIIFNGVPTGVEVCKAMHHGGPYPATTDCRFTSVGVDAIYRFVCPVSYQNFPDHLLPAELQNDNPLGILRCVDNEWTRSEISSVQQ